MLDWNTSRVAQQLRYGSYLTPRQLYELGAMMLTEGEPQVKLPRLNNTSHNTNQIDIQSVARMNDQSVHQYLSMQLAEANAAETSESSVQNVASSTTDGRPCIPSRKQREFINDTYKDEHYWEKRRKNNDAARRSREKRRYHDMVLENRICDLSKENSDLRNELSAIKRKFNLPVDQPFTDDAPNSTGQIQVPIPATSPGLKFRSDAASLQSSKPQISASSRSVAYSSPPPLLAVSGALPLQPSQTVYPSNGAQYPYYLNMPTSDTSRGVITHESNGSNSSSHTSMRNNFQSAYKELTIKEEQDDSKSPPPLSIALDAEVKPPVTTQSYDYYHHHGNQGYSSDSWQGSPSNSNSYGSDEPSEQPLQLTVRKDVDSSDPADKKESKSPQASSFPLKLRHKLPPQEYYSPIESSSTFPSRPYVNGLAQLSEIALAQANPLPLVKKSPHLPPQSMMGFSPGHRGSVDKPMNPKYIDPKYIERRRRNNEAARKCRENRKYVTNMREAKSDYLQQENGKLREELDSLQEEMKQLRELMEKKRLEQGLTEQEMDEKMKEGIPFEQTEESIAEQKRYREIEKKLAEHSSRMDDSVDDEDLYMDMNESVDDEEAIRERRESTEDVNSSSS